MKTFIKNLFVFLLVGSIPFIILVLGYFIFDPFGVLKDYDNYSYSYVLPNRDFISTEVFLKNHDVYDYNSFVFGSSRTLAFRPETWVGHLPPDSNPFIFDASGESIYGINKKLKLIDRMNVPIDHALIVLCWDISFQRSTNHAGHLFIKHPKLSGESPLSFHYTFLKAYADPSFLYSYYDYKISGNFKPYMSDYLENRRIAYDFVTNKMTIEDQNEELSENADSYYKKREGGFYKRDETVKVDTTAQINSLHIKLLDEIKLILDKHQTDYKVVISPLYNQVEFHPEDIAILRNYFGDNLCDFSGNNRITSNKRNYYETSHYLPMVGDSIMDIIYTKK